MPGCTSRRRHGQPLLTALYLFPDGGGVILVIATASLIGAALGEMLPGLLIPQDGPAASNVLMMGL